MPKILKTESWSPWGFEIRTEEVSPSDFGLEEDAGPSVVWQMGYTSEGHYIGDPKTTFYLCLDLGVVPELRQSTDKVCSIGFAQSAQKWYGWSHRAIHGFKIGDVVEEGDCCASSGWTEDYLQMHPKEDKSLPVGFVAKSLDDAKRMAIAFAESVS